MRLETMLLGVLCAATIGCTLDVGSGDGGGQFTPDATDWWQVDAGPWQIDASPQPPDAGPWQTVDAGPWQQNDAGPWQGDGGTPVVDAGLQPIDAGPWQQPDASPVEPDAGVGTDCASITSEAVCVVTPECEAMYQGVNCQCYPDGTCSCDSWEFSGCQ